MNFIGVMKGILFFFWLVNLLKNKTFTKKKDKFVKTVAKKRFQYFKKQRKALNLKYQNNSLYHSYWKTISKHFLQKFNLTVNLPIFTYEKKVLNGTTNLYERQ